MRMISMLLALLIIGLLVYKQLGGDAGKQAGATAQPAGVEAPAVPQVPTKPEDVKKFATQMNQFVEDEAKKRNSEIEAAEGH